MSGSPVQLIVPTPDVIVEFIYGHVTLAPALQIGLGRRDAEELYNESTRHAGPHAAQGGQG